MDGLWPFSDLGVHQLLLRLGVITTHQSITEFVVCVIWIALEMNFTVLGLCAIYNDFRCELFDYMSKFDPSFTDLTSIDKFNV